MAIRPSEDGTKHLIWIVRALSNLNCNLKHLGCVLIQYFQPISRNKNVLKFYTSWDSRNGLR